MTSVNNHPSDYPSDSSGNNSNNDSESDTGLPENISSTMTYATSSSESECKRRSNTNYASGKTIDKANGRRRTLAPILFRPNSTNTNSLSSLPSPPPPPPSSSSSSSSSSLQTSNKKSFAENDHTNHLRFKEVRKRSIDEASGDSNSNNDYHMNNSSPNNRENIQPTAMCLSTPIEAKEIFVNTIGSMSSISHQRSNIGAIDLESNNSKTLLKVDDCTTKIQIHSNSKNDNDTMSDGTKANFSKKYGTTSTSSPSPPSYSSASSGYKTQTENTNSTTTLRRSKRIRSKRQKETNGNTKEDCNSSSSSCSFSSQKNTSSLASPSLSSTSSCTEMILRKTKANKSSCNFPSTQSHQEKIMNNNPTNEPASLNARSNNVHQIYSGSIDVDAISKSIQLSLSVTSPPASSLKKQHSSKTIVLDEESMKYEETKNHKSGGAGTKNTTTAMTNRRGRRRSVRLSKRKLLSEEDRVNIQIAVSTNDDEPNDNHSTLVINNANDDNNFTDDKEKHPQLFNEDDFESAYQNRPKSRTSRRKSIRSSKGVPPARFRDRNILLNTETSKSHEIVSNKESIKENLDTETSEPNTKDRKHYGSTIVLECNQHLVNQKSPETTLKSQNNQIGQQKTALKKRRRRSSLGLHAGGLISVGDIERVGREAIARKKLRDQKMLSNEMDFHTREKKHKDDTAQSPTSIHEPVAPLAATLNDEPHEKIQSTKHTHINKVDLLRELQYIPRADDINIKINEFLQRKDVQEKPIMSARLFACVILVQEHKDKNFNIESLLPLLRAFVEAELSSLRDTEVKDDFSKKKLHFCSTDNSSMITPVDTEEQSESVIEGCIEAFHNVLKEFQIFSQKSHWACLRTFISTFEQINKLPHYGACLTECAKAMPCYWSPSRFKRVSEYYLSELELLSCENFEGKSQIRQCLGDIIGRSIRFYLRKFFNPVPVSLHTYSNSEQPDYDFSRSDVHKIVELTDSEEQRDTAVADGSISSVVSLAILRIHEFNDSTGWFDSASKPNLIFCDRPASQTGIVCRGSVIELRETELEEVLIDVEETHIVLAGIRACKFFLTLMRWKGVSQAIENIGGWRIVEQFAKIFAENKLYKESPDEMHFQLLSNVDELLQKIENDVNLLSQVEEQCDDSLRRLWKRFRCGTKSKDLLKLNPGIKVIRQVVKAGNETYFPSIIAAEP